MPEYYDSDEYELMIKTDVLDVLVKSERSKGWILRILEE
mgnify:CR=1 FL=1|jgi:hypothetical protein